MIRGWSLTAAISAAVSAISLPILFAGGLQEDALRLFLRATARCSLALFLFAFCASSLVRLVPGAFTRWLAQNRRYVGVSFAFSHTLHLFAIIALIRMKPGSFSGPDGLITLIGGGTAFLLLYAMVFTSFDRTAAWLGSRWWRRLHKTGMHYFWFIFFLDYVLPAFSRPHYIPFALPVVGAMSIRIAAWRKKRTRINK